MREFTVDIDSDWALGSSSRSDKNFPKGPKLNITEQYEIYKHYKYKRKTWKG